MEDWQVVDRALRTIHHRRAGLDAEEARWLREAEALQIWRPLGMVSALDYMERVMGYAPRTALERLRVARALGGLPRLTAALATGDLAFSAVRELTRVATAATEAAWVARAAGQNLRQIEELVADHHLGDHPDDPKDPAARRHVVRLELSAETFALLRQARQVLDDEHGSSLSEDELVAQLCSAVLDHAPTSETTGRAKFQLAVTVCERCGQGWQRGAGAKIPIGADAVERAMCDAQHIGSIDGAAPARAHQDISPSVRRFVWHRDGGRCCVPGCRSARGLEAHHLVHRADGGGHDAANICLLCSSCHQAHHAGTLTITGSAGRVAVVRSARARSSAAAGVMVTDATRSELANCGPHVGAKLDATAAHDKATVRDAAAANDETKRLDEAAAHDKATVRDAPAANDETKRLDATAAHDKATVRDAAAANDETKRFDEAAGHDEATLRDATAANDEAKVRDDAKAALTQLGWKPSIAHLAVTAAASALAADSPLERVIFEALRRCPQRGHTAPPPA